ncbi:hypothetical protein V2H90_07590 [Glaesserella parasuis]|uniref:hypothetical protein n=1 Tax=Glaesserella parasuis TaxID=738 RepID=UPI002E996205|nr:hypothetical protein [Glaesserella parasuis]
MTDNTEEKLAILRKVEDEYRKERAEAQTLLGRAEAFNFMKTFLEFSELKTIERIKETKAYKNLQMFDKKTGEQKQIDTFKEFCECLGVSYDTINNHLNYLRDLGEPLYKESVRLGLTNKEMRRLRALPDETIIDIAKIDFSEDEDKSQLVKKLAEAEKMVEKLSDTVEEQAETLKETTQKLEESQQNYEALSRVNENKDKRINQLDLDLQKSKQLIKTATPDELGAILREKASLIAYGIQAQIIAQLRPAFDELEKHSNETNIDHRQFMSGIIGQLYVEINEIQSYFNLNEFADGNNLLDWERGIFKKEDNEIDERMQAILDAEILG